MAFSATLLETISVLHAPIYCEAGSNDAEARGARDGKAGIRHLSAAQELDAVEVVGVADRAPELLKVLPDELAQNAED